MLRLRDDFARNELGLRARVCDDEHFRRTGQAVDADAPEDLALGLGDVDVARADDLVDRCDGRRAERERADRLRAADGVQLVDLGERTGVQHGGIDVTVALRRCRHDDASDARDLGGDDRHQHRRGQRRACRPGRMRRPRRAAAQGTHSASDRARGSRSGRATDARGIRRSARARARAPSRSARGRDAARSCATARRRAALPASRRRSPSAACTRAAPRRRARARRRGCRARSRRSRVGGSQPPAYSPRSAASSVASTIFTSPCARSQRCLHGRPRRDGRRPR